MSNRRNVTMTKFPERSPPFTFADSPPTKLDGLLPAAQLSSATEEDSGRDTGVTNSRVACRVWTCETCCKVKELSGSHLNGKQRVRSDCWPCGKKRYFTCCTFPGTGSTQGNLARSPDSVPSFFSTTSSQDGDRFMRFEAPRLTTDQFTSLLTTFSLDLLRHYRAQLSDADFNLRCAWDRNVLYVVAHEAQQSTDKYTLEAIFSDLALFASFLLSVEQFIFSSRRQSMRRLFCPTEFSFAAACCYGRSFSATKQWECSVFGPERDPTTTQTHLSTIVSQCPHTALSVSELQRLHAVQTLYQRAGWVCSSALAGGVAMRELEAAKHNDDGLDVVLIPRTEKFESLPNYMASIAMSLLNV